MTVRQVFRRVALRRPTDCGRAGEHGRPGSPRVFPDIVRASASAGGPVRGELGLFFRFVCCGEPELLVLPGERRLCRLSVGARVGASGTGMS